ncbi:MAG: L-aspartate oxidase, partial [Elusimicrobia bacterium]|nr:L-aspartate oxidase [Elusimicrobiota bacterium]
MANSRFDFLVIGSGLAGLSAALRLSRHGSVAVLSKKKLLNSNTDKAQGGIAGVSSSEDSFDLHSADTLRAGAGLCDETVVKTIIQQGPEVISELAKLGVPFARNGQRYELGLEGGHTKRRVLHVEDTTGHSIAEALVAACCREKNITLLEHCAAVDLLLDEHARDLPPESNRCHGAYYLDSRSGKVRALTASFTLLASGGAGKVYKYTTNPEVATGDGMAMAFRAGVPLKNMEFVQFHPTCLYHPKLKSFLISEAVRGEGAILRLQDGTAFMKKYSPQAELAPRDIVARAIDAELKKTGAECVYLDATALGAAFLKKRFPNIFKTCLAHGLDITKQPIPVVPAAHFFCGGVAVDSRGATAMPGLYAAGETACTGLHGANRLASNSLLEACVCARTAADDMLKRFLDGERAPLRKNPPPQAANLVAFIRLLDPSQGFSTLLGSWTYRSSF